jgi:hypothetical protein
VRNAAQKNVREDDDEAEDDRLEETILSMVLHAASVFSGK